MISMTSRGNVTHKLTDLKPYRERAKTSLSEGFFFKVEKRYKRKVFKNYIFKM